MKSGKWFDKNSDLYSENKNGQPTDRQTNPTDQNAFQDQFRNVKKQNQSDTVLFLLCRWFKVYVYSETTERIDLEICFFLKIISNTAVTVSVGLTWSAVSLHIWFVHIAQISQCKSINVLCSRCWVGSLSSLLQRRTTLVLMYVWPVTLWEWGRAGQLASLCWVRQHFSGCWLLR